MVQKELLESGHRFSAFQNKNGHMLKICWTRGFIHIIQTV